MGTEQQQVGQVRTVRDMGKELAGPKIQAGIPTPAKSKGPYFPRDAAQEWTLAVWCKRQDKVLIHLVDGRSFQGLILRVGPYSIQMKDDDNVLGICVFKTAIVDVMGPEPTSVGHGG